MVMYRIFEKRTGFPCGGEYNVIGLSKAAAKIKAVEIGKINADIKELYELADTFEKIRLRKSISEVSVESWRNFLKPLWLELVVINGDVMVQNNLTSSIVTYDRLSEEVYKNTVKLIRYLSEQRDSWKFYDHYRTETVGLSVPEKPREKSFKIGPREIMEVFNKK